MWPWTTFLIACLGRAFAASSFVLLIESYVLGFAPPLLRTFAFFGAGACLAVTLSKQIIGAFCIGPLPDMMVKAESGFFRGESVAWATCAMRGWREAMEDSHVVASLDPACLGSGYKAADACIFAVLDGHGGAEVSALAAQLLIAEIEACAHARLRRSSADKAVVPLAEALSEALPKIDATLKAGCWGLGRAMPLALHPFALVGSTCCVAAVDFVRREVHVANIGDSRALLIRGGKVLALSDDHKPENPVERSRIRAAGGQVIKMGPCYRVDGNLNLSRALGDFHLKANPSLPPEKQKVIAFPDSTCTSFKGPGELLVVACDGLFERLSNQEVGDIIWPRFQKGMALDRIASELLHLCCARASHGRPIEEGTDNETVILVKLPPAEAASKQGASGEFRQAGSEELPATSEAS